jgi:hypothetical protein
MTRMEHKQKVKKHSVVSGLKKTSFRWIKITFEILLPNWNLYRISSIMNDTLNTKKKKKNERLMHKRQTRSQSMYIMKPILM